MTIHHCGVSQRGTGDDASFERALLAVVSEVVYPVDVTGSDVTWADPALVDLLGWTPGQVKALGAEVRTVAFHPEDLARVLAANDAVAGLRDGQVLETRYRLRHASGGYHWMSRRLTPMVRDGAGIVIEAMAATRDVSEAVQLDERLTHAALHDALTGLPSRALLLDRLSSALQRRSRTGGVVPVLFCDLDGFKHVNDTSGHRAGDRVLVATAERLRGALRPQDTVARVGGDEFVIVLESSQPLTLDRQPAGVTDPAAGPEPLRGDARAETLAIIARLIDAVSEPVSVHDDVEGATAHSISVSIGVVFAAGGSEPEEVLRQADSAMYRAKSSGKGRYQVFDGSFHAEVVERGHIEQSLRGALVTDGPARAGQGEALSVVYQPIFDLATMEITGVEALARLTDAFGVALAPDEFIPVAERAGLIRRLGRVVLEAACHDLAEWHRRFPSRAGLGVAVNLTARQVGGIDLVGDIRGALGRSGLSPTLLTLELAESVLSGADHGATTALNLLQVDGVKISIDDFGTGYASLRYLAQLPVASVKVDQSFTAGLPVDRTSVTMVRAVAALARDLGIACVVEGIETAAQLQALPKGVQGQGFWLGRPMTAARLTGLLEGCGLKQLEAPIGGLTACRSVRANRRSSEPAAS